MPKKSGGKKKSTSKRKAAPKRGEARPKAVAVVHVVPGQKGKGLLGSVFRVGNSLTDALGL